MQRNRRPHPHPAISRGRLLILLLLFGLVLAALCGLFSCAFQPMLTARGTLFFLPGS